MADRTGSPNKNTKFLNNRLKAMYGDDFEPMMKAAECAFRMQEIASGKAVGADDIKALGIGSEDLSSLVENEFNMQKECLVAWEKIGRYTSPQLKAVELTGPEGGPVMVESTTFVGVNAKD